MNREIFVVYNASTNSVEIKDFGILILPDVSVDLVDFDNAYVSDEVDNYLSTGDLIRLINGVSVGYSDAYTQSSENIVVDGSLYLGQIGDLEVYANVWNQRHTNAFSEGGSGITQVAPYDVSTDNIGNWVPWGDIIWDASGLGSTLEYNNWSIWFADIARPILVDTSTDFSAYPDGVYCTYVGHDPSFNPYVDISTNMDREFRANPIFFSIVLIRDGLVKNIGNYPDIFSTGKMMRSLVHTAEFQFTGLDLIADTSSSITRDWGQYLLEGANYDGMDFYNNSFTEPQNLSTFEAITLMIFTETHPTKGIDPSVSEYTDYRLYSNRYWNKDLGDFAYSASDGFFIISAVHLSSREERHLVRRGSVLYPNLLDALEAIEQFPGNSADIPQPMEEAFPLISYIVHRTNLDDITNTTQLRFTRSATGAGGTTEGGATGFGQYAAYAAQIPELSTTSITFVNALQMITDPSALASTYRIGWTLQLSNSKVGKESNYRVTLDGSILESVFSAAFTANGYSNWSGFQHAYVADGSHNISVDYSATTGSTAYIRDIRLEFFRAATDETE